MNYAELLHDLKLYFDEYIGLIIFLLIMLGILYLAFHNKKESPKKIKSKPVSFDRKVEAMMLPEEKIKSYEERINLIDTEGDNKIKELEDIDALYETQIKKLKEQYNNNRNRIKAEVELLKKNKEKLKHLLELANTQMMYEQDEFLNGGK